MLPRFDAPRRLLAMVGECEEGGRAEMPLLYLLYYRQARVLSFDWHVVCFV